MRKSIWAFEIAALVLTVATANANMHDITAPPSAPASAPVAAATMPAAISQAPPPPPAPPAARPDLRGTQAMPLSVEVLDSGAGQIAAALTAREAGAAYLAARIFELQASLLLFLVLLAAALLYQGFWVRHFISQSARQFALTHRPHLRIRHIWRLSELAAGQAVSVDLLVANTGLVPALVRQMRLAMVVLPNGREVPPDLLSGRHASFVVPLIIDGKKIPPIVSGGTHLFSGLTDGRPLSARQNDELRDRTSKLYVVGSIEYQDPQGIGTRMIGFCRYLAVIDQRAVPAFSDVGRFRLVDESEYEFED